MTIQDILEELIESPYPDYNLGLLPDEEGYDTHKIERIYNHKEDIDQALSQIQELVAEEIIRYQTIQDNVDKRTNQIVERIELFRILTAKQQKVLLEIDATLSPTLTTISNNTGFAISTVQRALEKLIAIGLVEKNGKTYQRTNLKAIMRGNDENTSIN